METKPSTTLGTGAVHDLQVAGVHREEGAFSRVGAVSSDYEGAIPVVRRWADDDLVLVGKPLRLDSIAILGSSPIVRIGLVKAPLTGWKREGELVYVTVSSCSCGVGLFWCGCVVPV